jgi:serine phosphatase RsbU (regulator of sigma subunit)/anti-sigma regulatory factor (Ser/Thr protein kinase)
MLSDPISVTIFFLLSSAVMIGLLMLLWRIDRKTRFGSWKWRRILLVGLYAGAIACLAVMVGLRTIVGGMDTAENSFSVPLNLSCLPILAAGLFFDPLSALLAAGIVTVLHAVMMLQEGVSILYTVFLGVGVFAPGLMAFVLGKFILKRSEPSPFQCFAIGFMAEIVNLLSIMLCFKDAVIASLLFDFFVVPLLVTASVSFMVLGIIFFAFEKKLNEAVKKKSLQETPIAGTFQKKLRRIITLTFVCLMLFTIYTEYSFAISGAQQSLKYALSDLKSSLDYYVKQSGNQENLAEIAANRRVGIYGYLAVMKDGETVSVTEGMKGFTFNQEELREASSSGTYFRFDIFQEGNGSETCYCSSEESDGCLMVAFLPTAEVYKNLILSTFENLFCEMLLFGILFVAIYMLMQKQVVKSLNGVNCSLSKITAGDLNETVDVRTSSEFTSLSSDINATVGTLKKLISEAENRNNAELAMAREIQRSALPSGVPIRKEFDLHATMNPAKEVGGDFYDYFFRDETHQVLVIADVSGKGIPASLFMMKGKTLIRNYAMAGNSPSKILQMANEELCDGNDAEMFITVWVGILDLETGIMTCGNAGHEYPAVMRKGGKFELVMDRHDFVLGGMPGIPYRESRISLQPGDSIFVYTDGVTEATDSEKQLYGTERMLDALNRTTEMTPKERIACVRKDIDAFVGEAPQFDDITMLSFSMKEPGTVFKDELTVNAEIESLPEVEDFIQKRLEGAGCAREIIDQVLIAAEEIYVNIAHYAYKPLTGCAAVRCTTEEETGKMILRFRDSGMQFNPLMKKDADTTLSADERPIGGLGILMVKKSMDEVSYVYEDGQNIFTMVKNFREIADGGK